MSKSLIFGFFEKKKLFFCWASFPIPLKSMGTEYWRETEVFPKFIFLIMKILKNKMGNDKEELYNPKKDVKEKEIKPLNGIR